MKVRVYTVLPERFLELHPEAFFDFSFLESTYKVKRLDFENDNHYALRCDRFYEALFKSARVKIDKTNTIESVLRSAKKVLWLQAHRFLIGKTFKEVLHRDSLLCITTSDLSFGQKMRLFYRGVGIFDRNFGPIT
jgi:hypothetical protein